MTTQDEIKRLERKIADLKAAQSNCQHEWGEAKYTPYTRQEERIVPGEYEKQGIHMWPRTTFVDVQKPRWTRTCNKCGLEQHTEKQREIQQPKQHTPDFGA